MWSPQGVHVGQQGACGVQKVSMACPQGGACGVHKGCAGY
jgi:hypothetical protein